MSHSELTVCEISQMFFRDPSRKVRDDTDGCNFLILSYCSPVLGELSKGLMVACIYIIAFFLCSSTCCMYSFISSVRDLMIATTPEHTNW